MTGHRHASRAASDACTDPECLARLASALERAAAGTAAINAFAVDAAAGARLRDQARRDEESKQS